MNAQGFNRRWDADGFEMRPLSVEMIEHVRARDGEKNAANGNAGAHKINCRHGLDIAPDSVSESRVSNAVEFSTNHDHLSSENPATF
jgi:hypothetical protein